MNQEDMIIQEIELYLCSFKVDHSHPSAPGAEKMDVLAQGIRSYFEKYPEEWEPLAEYIETGSKDDRLGFVLERLLVPDLVRRVHRYLREELGYEWLTSERIFAYDYSF